MPADPEHDHVLLRNAIMRRHMVRSFATTPVDQATLDRMLDLARRAPSAGNTQAAEFLVLDTPASVAAYWDVTLPPERRSTFRWQSMLEAPALVIVMTRPGAYVERYAEPDKARPGLGDDPDRWQVPYWWVDAGAVVQNLLLLITEAELGACLFGLFDHEPGVLDAFGVPDGWRAVATIAIGHPLDDADERAQRGRSADRPRRPADEIIHRGRWRTDPR